MSDDLHRDEAELISALNPPINAMGANMAAERDLLNKALHAQLTFVREQLDHYLPTKPRGWGDDSQMPHEWGSMDTYDDMRNSMRLAALMADDLLDPISPRSDDQAEQLRQVIVAAESGLCAVASEVLELAGLAGDDDFEVLAKSARAYEQRMHLEPNSVYPTDR